MTMLIRSNSLLTADVTSTFRVILVGPPMHHVVYYNHTEVVKHLIPEENIDVDLPNEN